MLGFSKSMLIASLMLLMGSSTSSLQAQEGCDTCQSSRSGSYCQNCKGPCRHGNHNGQCDYDCHHKKFFLPYWMVPDAFKEEEQIPGVKRWSREDYYLRGQLPVGQPQKCYKGEIWPVDPRPTGPKPHMIHRFHAAHYWPYPYNIWSENSVRSTIALQEQKGWQDATTLYSYHFNEDSNELTDSGVLHMRWILQNAPVQYRTFYLQTSSSAGANDLRMAEVVQVAGRLAPGQEPPQVMLRNTIPVGRPAVEVDMIRNLELGSMPSPRIQYTSGSVQP